MLPCISLLDFRNHTINDFRSSTHDIDIHHPHEYPFITLFLASDLVKLINSTLAKCKGGPMRFSISSDILFPFEISNIWVPVITVW